VRHRLILASFLALATVVPAQAGLFRKTAKPEPSVYVPALVEVLKAGTDERARVAAANELRDYDAKTFPEILPALIEALASDASASVRGEAAESIGKVRPVTAQAGYALEQARSKDKSLIVRARAERALLYYRLLGVVGTKTEILVQSSEPPLATANAAKASDGSVILRPTPSPVPVNDPVAPPATPKLIGPMGDPDADPKPGTFEPPLAEPKKTTTLTDRPKTPAPIIVIPTPEKDAIVPVPTTPKPDPKDLPGDVSKPAGPTLPPPPKN
jgi:hypothetical protein